jgi:hypothetical protein
MFTGGPMWKPPILPFVEYGMPISDDEDGFEDEKNAQKLKEPKMLPIGQNRTSQFGFMPKDDEKDESSPTRIYSNTELEKERVNY